MSPSELLERLVAALPAGDGPVELSAQAVRQGATRFAGSRVTQTGSVEDVTVQARAIRGGRLGAARGNAIDREAIARLVAEAAAIAEAQPAATAELRFADGKDALPEVTPSWDEATACAGASVRAELVAPAFAEARAAGQTASGLAAIGETTFAVATSEGCRRSAHTTSARLDVIASATGGASGHAARFATRLATVQAEAQAIAREAVDVARRSDVTDPVELAPGDYDVILAPAAVAELCEWLALTSFGARGVADGSSCLAGRAGQARTGPITIVDDALSGDGGLPTLPFDAEGSAKRRVVFFERGVAGEVVHDRASAARAGIASTGHASPVGEELFEGGPIPLHLSFAAGDDDLAALLSRVERGLWVTRFHYVNGLLDTRRALMTGMTRDGLFVIENGRVGRPARNRRWTQSVLEAFARLAGVTRERRLVAAGLSDSVALCPSVLVRGWHFA